MRSALLAALLLLAGIAALAWRFYRDRMAYARAERLYQAGEYEKASLECERVLSRRPHHAPARALFMEVQFILGQGTVEAPVYNYDRFMTKPYYALSFVEIDRALDRAERREDPERELRRVFEYAKWLPEGPELQRRLDRARVLLAR